MANKNSKSARRSSKSKGKGHAKKSAQKSNPRTDSKVSIEAPLNVMQETSVVTLSDARVIPRMDSKVSIESPPNLKQETLVVATVVSPPSDTPVKLQVSAVLNTASDDALPSKNASFLESLSSFCAGDKPSRMVTDDSVIGTANRWKVLASTRVGQVKGQIKPIETICQKPKETTESVPTPVFYADDENRPWYVKPVDSDDPNWMFPVSRSYSFGGKNKGPPRWAGFSHWDEKGRPVFKLHESGPSYEPPFKPPPVKRPQLGVIDWGPIQQFCSKRLGRYYFFPVREW